MSIRRRLLVGILLPVLGLIALNAAGQYEEALDAADIAYDRTLLASAKSIGELLEVTGSGEAATLRATVPYSALEAFESDNRSRMVYRVTGFQGETVSGYADLPSWQGTIPAKGPYAALVDFYDGEYHGEPVRIGVLLQPVAGRDGRGVATIQVAETLELRETLARQLLIDTLRRQAVLIAVIGVVVVVVVQAATRPVRALSARLRDRPENDLTPIDATGAPRELRPLLDATNQVMARLGHLVDHQKRFVRDTSHQLRTPLAVLKTQVQSALRGDVDPTEALREIAGTVDRATELANQMLALARVEQLRQQDDAPVADWAAATRAVALDLAPLIADRQLDFSLDISLDAGTAPVRAHAWALRELGRNLLHNAVQHTPSGGRLAVRLVADTAEATLTIADSGAGMAPDMRARLFQPFAAGAGGHAARRGTGLGLAICHEIVQSLGGRIALVDRRAEAGSDAVRGLDSPAAREVVGLDAVVHLPIAENAGRC